MVGIKWILGGIGIILFFLFRKINEIRHDQIIAGKDSGLVTIFKKFLSSFFVPVEKYPSTNEEKAAGGIPQFYNQVDHTRGRFLGWVRNERDKADARVIQGEFFRARLLLDVKYFGIFPASKEVLTPPVFRPSIDAIFKGPGEAQGIPGEGLVILKRSIDGKDLGATANDRFRFLLMDEKHKSALMADAIYTMQDKERLAVAYAADGEWSEELQAKLRRMRKASSTTEPTSSGFSNPYQHEMYGTEGAMEPGQIEGNNNQQAGWNIKY